MEEFQNSYYEEFKEFGNSFSLNTLKLSNGEVSYILCRPENAAHTLVLVNGGNDSYEMWLRYYQELC